MNVTLGLKRRLAGEQRFMAAMPSVAVSISGFACQGDLSDNTPTKEFHPSNSLLTPNADFYVRNHFNPPMLDVSAWKVRFSGAVRHPLEITLRDLAELPQRSLMATVECAGNPVGGSMVGTAKWVGVQLARLLEKADPIPGVRIIQLKGADQAATSSDIDAPISNFVRSISLAKALHPDTLLAYQMNGEVLPAKHGYPLRAIVPGWYGMDSVKWLAEVTALKKEDVNNYVDAEYVRSRLGVVGAQWQPVTQIQVKSQILTPQNGDVLPPGPYDITGVAWAGDRQVASVEVSTDGGTNWMTANVQSEAKAYTWVLWSYRWLPRTKDQYLIVARATDNEGNRQPATADPLRLDAYEQNWYHSVQCEVR